MIVSTQVIVYIVVSTVIRIIIVKTIGKKKVCEHCKAELQSQPKRKLVLKEHPVR